MKESYPYKISAVKLISVIETQSERGDGSERQPVRTVMEYWSLDGKKLAEFDPYYLDLIEEASGQGR